MARYVAPKVERTSVQTWKQGVVSAFDSGRTPLDGLDNAYNVVINPDGTLSPRPSMMLYGPQPVGTILGEIFEFKQQTGNDSTIWMASVQKILQSEKQSLTISGSPTGGTFTLTFNGQTTAAIAYNANAAAVQSALVALSSIGSGNVTCTGGPLPSTGITITFAGTLANTDVALITSTSSLTGGTSPAITLSQAQKGGEAAYAYVARGEDATWTKCSTTTFDVSARAHFLQIQNKVLVLNGIDNLTFLDITTVLTTRTMTRYTPLSTPSAPTLTSIAGSLSGTNFNIYYAVTANSTVGQTAGSSVFTQPVGTDRDVWNPDTQYITIEWAAVTGAQSYNVYMGISADGAGTPKLYLIASGIDASTRTFTDNGTRGQDLLQPLPTQDSTAGPKASRGWVINGRPWLLGDPDDPYKIWRGGDYGFELDFSPANGGGFTIVGNGSKEVPTVVRPFRDGKGDPRITVLSRGTNGYGKRFIISPTTQTYGTFSFIVWEVNEESGQDGTDSPDGVVTYGNSLYYLSRDGFKTTGTKPQLQNVLSTDKFTDTIQDQISRLNTSKMSLCVGLAYEGRAYWALPVGSDRNNEIWVLDFTQGGAWMRPWTIAADWMWLYNDNNGTTHFCILQNNKIYELSNTPLANDDGVAFLTSLLSGMHFFSKDQREWAKLINVVATVLKPQGNITITITCMTEDGILTFSQSETFGSEKSVAGWGEPSRRGMKGWGRRAWSAVENVPQVSTIASADMIIEIDEEVLWWTYSLRTTDSGVRYNLSNIVPEFVSVGIKDLS